MSWKCKNCGYQKTGDEEGFILLGGGFVECPSCKAHHCLISGGELKLIREADIKHYGS